MSMTPFLLIVQAFGGSCSSYGSGAHGRPAGPERYGYEVLQSRQIGVSKPDVGIACAIRFAGSRTAQLS